VELIRSFCDNSRRSAQHRGQADEEGDFLAPLYGQFTEGFDTLDLRQAETLLDGLTA
jgi:predicted ATPase